MAKKEDLKKLAVQYAELVAKENAIKAEKEEVQTKLKAEMKTAGADRIETNQGTFTIYKRTNWQYPEAHAVLLGQVKEAETKWQESGEAKLSLTESFRYTPAKNESTN